MLRELLSLFVFILFSQAAFAEYRVKDFLGRDVVLEKPAQRIIALAPHIVENIYSAGAGQYIVGAVDYCDYPESAKQIPRVGSISGYSIEAIVGAKPDLVVVWRSGRGGAIMEKLIQLGLTVYANDPRSLPDVAKAIRDYGVLSDTQPVAEKAADTFLKRYEKLKKQYSHLSPVSSLYQVWNDPMQTLNGKHIISDVIELCGGRNVFADSPALAPKISIESVIQQNPETIVASGMGEERPEWLEEWKQWPSLQAVKSNNLFFIPPDILQRHTMRILSGAEMFCQHLDGARAKRATAK